MLEAAHPEPTDETDGRRRKGARQRRKLLEATLAVVDRAGVAGVSQRAVAAQAGVSPAAVLYYFDSVDDLLAAALALVNDSYLAALESAPVDADPLEVLVEVVVTATGRERRFAVAELELSLQAARDPALAPQLERWWKAVDALLEPTVPDPDRRRAVIAAVDGLCLQRLVSAPPPTKAEVLAVLRAATA